MTRPLFERMDLSQKRRILTVGDIHGRFDLLEEKLENLVFDPDLDILIMLGDLVDRGEQSHLALEWCNRPGMIRVRGNHDQMVADVVKNEFQHLSDHLAGGGAWFCKIQDEDERQRWAETMIDCPIAIEAIIPSGQRIGFIHADVPVNNWNDLENALERSNPEKPFSIAWNCMWTRQRLKELREYATINETVVGHDCSIAGIDHVFFGHSIVADIVTHNNCSWIDTGAFKTDRLAVIDVIEHMAKARRLESYMPRPFSKPKRGKEIVTC